MASSDQCGMCRFDVSRLQQGLECDECKTWFHRTCTRGTISWLTQKEYFRQKGKCFPWKCPLCKRTVSIAIHYRYYICILFRFLTTASGMVIAYYFLIIPSVYIPFEYCFTGCSGC